MDISKIYKQLWVGLSIPRIDNEPYLINLVMDELINMIQDELSWYMLILSINETTQNFNKNLNYEETL